MQFKKTVCATLLLLAVFIMPYEAYAQEEPQVTEQAAPIFPIDFEEKVENNYNVIIRTYALKPNEDPRNIPMNSFEKYGETYELSEVIKKENRSENKLEHKETMTINTADNDMNEILKQLPLEISHDKDGYSGKLKLDISTVLCEPAGYKTNSYTLKISREYPHLSSNDTSLVPKTVNDKGVTYSLADVSFQTQSTNSIDYESVPLSYTAYATYTANGSSKNVTGYITTAEYSGQIVRTLTNETIYKVYFTSKKPVVETEPEPAPMPETDSDTESNPDTESEPERASVERPKSELSDDVKKVFSIILPIILFVLAMVVLAGVALFLFSKLSYNTIVFGKQGFEYKKLGRMKVDYKTDNLVVNLNKFVPKAPSDEFVIEVSKKAMKTIFARGKEINEICNEYKGMSINHTIMPYVATNKYQYEINFSDDIGDDENEEI